MIFRNSTARDQKFQKIVEFLLQVRLLTHWPTWNMIDDGVRCKLRKYKHQLRRERFTVRGYKIYIAIKVWQPSRWRHLKNIRYLDANAFKNNTGALLEEGVEEKKQCKNYLLFILRTKNACINLSKFRVWNQARGYNCTRGKSSVIHLRVELVHTSCCVNIIPINLFSLAACRVSFSFFLYFFEILGTCGHPRP